MGVLALMLTTAINAAVGDMFSIDNLFYTVLTENPDNATGTVSVKTASTSISNEVVIPSSVTYNSVDYSVVEIPYGGFQNCKRIKSVAIPNTVTKMGGGCFSNCTQMESITLSSKTTGIPYNSFNNCSALQSITIPNTCTAIEENAFESCKALTNVTIGSGVKTIGEYAFAYCNSLTSISLPTKLTTLSKYSFYNCTSLTTVNLQNAGIKYLYDYTFSGCSNLTTINLGNKLQRIYDRAFENCTSLENITIPTNVSTLQTTAFLGCTNLKAVNVDENNSTFYSVDGVLFKTDGFNLTYYPEGKSDKTYSVPDGTISLTSFLKNKYLEEVILPNTVKSINNSCFASMGNLQRINLPEGLEFIGVQAFAYCKKLNNIILPQSLKEVRHMAFIGCNSLTHINIPAGADFKGWGNNSTNDLSCGWHFQDCISLKDVTIDEGVTKLASGMFYNTAIETIFIPSSVKEIYKSTFKNCKNLKDVQLSGGVEVMGNNIFGDCSSLRIIKLPNSLKVMGAWDHTLTSDGNLGQYGLFEKDYLISHITLPSWLEQLGDIAPNTVISGNKKYDSAATNMGTTNSTEITIPAYVKNMVPLSIGDSSPNLPYPAYSAIFTPISPVVNNGTMTGNYIHSIFVMGDSIPEGLKYNESYDKYNNMPVTIYVKQTVLNNKYPSGTWNEKIVSSKIPLSMTNAAGNPIEYKTLCRDFDVDLTHTNDNLPEGVEPLRAYLVEDVDGDLRMVFMNEIKYIPSRLKANVTDEDGNLYQGVDEYVGVVLRGTPGYTYYYEMGEHDYTQGAEGQWLMDEAMSYSNASFEQNLMAGDANDEFYVHKVVEDEDNNEIVNYGLNNGRFKIYYKDGWLNYNKSYLQLSKDVSAAIERTTDTEGNANLTFVFSNSDGSTDKISSVEFMKNAESDIFYNPYGQRVSKDTKGIVINNGKKFVNK